jgi:peptidoglycan/LPS O-acetylase OafA/YrhL
VALFFMISAFLFYCPAKSGKNSLYQISSHDRVRRHNARSAKKPRCWPAVGVALFFMISAFLFYRWLDNDGLTPGELTHKLMKKKLPCEIREK